MPNIFPVLIIRVVVVFYTNLFSPINFPDNTHATCNNERSCNTYARNT